MEYIYFLTLMNDLGTLCNGVRLIVIQFLEGLFRRQKKEPFQAALKARRMSYYSSYLQYEQ